MSWHLDLLACPACGAGLKADLPGAPSMVGTAGLPPRQGNGELACACGARFPVVGGIARLVPGLQGLDRRTQESFAFEWLAYPGPLPEEDRSIFLEETQIPEAEWRGKLALDGGCGMGRYARTAEALGARVVALDLGRALERLSDRIGEGLQAVQGDLLNPPLREGRFDIVYSQGVIHHTPDARRAFLRLARLVKPGGLLSVWVYGAPGPYAEFRENPLRPGREWLRRWMRAAYAVVWTREKASDAVRAVTTRLPIRAVYALCGPLAAVGAVPVAKYLTFSVHPDFRVRRIENFDWLSPPYQSHHTRSELQEWCREAGVEPLRWLAHGLVPKVGVLARKA